MGNPMNTRNIVAVLTAITLLSGCSIFERKQVDYKTAAAEAPALEVPPDLTKGVTDRRFAIPAADGTQVAKYSDFTREKSGDASGAASASAPVAAVPPALVFAPMQREIGGIRFLLLAEPFDRTWRKVGLALEKAGIAVADMDRSKGVYFLKGAAKDKKSADIQVWVREANGMSDVTVREGTDPSSKEASRLVDIVFQNLEK